MSNENKDGVKTLQVDVSGMHCPNCEVLVERRIKSVPGVHGVTARHTSGTAIIHHEGEADIAAFHRAVEDEGYGVMPAGQGARVSSRRDVVEIGAAVVILLGAFALLRRLDLLPNSIGLSDNMSLGVVFLIGLLASVSSCIAVTGGLLVAVAAKYNEAAGSTSGGQRIKPLLYFNAGRIASYTLLGGAIGAIGASLTLTPRVNGIIMIAASVFMILLGLQMIKVLPSLGRLMPRLSNRIAHKVHDLAGPEVKGGAFALGAATFFLPCAFTQALQLYALSLGSFRAGALTMLAFALGTLPALLSLSALSSFASGGFQRHFLKFAGVAVILLGLFNIQYGVTLSGNGMQAAPGAVAAEPPSSTLATSSTLGGLEGSQVIVMKVSGFDYIPNRFTVKQGVPVIWRIDGSEAEGCGRLLMAPGLGIRRIMSSNSTTTITFTPMAAGDYEFNCGMGMMTPHSTITVLPANG